MTEREALAALQAENLRLVALLESHGIAWHAPPAAASPAAPLASVPAPAPASPGPSLSTAEKVALFRRLFRGRTDVYPVRWEGKTSGKSGYAPACANEWRAGVCEKPRIKCGEKRQRGYRAMGYRVGVDARDGQASMADVEVPGLLPFEQLFAGQEAAAGAANGLGP